MPEMHSYADNDPYCVNNEDVKHETGEVLVHLYVVLTGNKATDFCQDTIVIGS